MRPAVPLYWRATPADFVPFFRKPVSSTISTPSRSAKRSTTYPRHRSRAAASSHCTCESSRCVRHGRASPRCSASCQPFLRSTALSRPSRYSPACRRGSERPNSSPKRACNLLSSDRQSKIPATLTRPLAAIHHRSQQYGPYARKLNCSTKRGPSNGKHCCGTQFRGCHAVASAKRAVEIGQIPEPAIERYGADLLIAIEGTPQHPVRTDKALRQHVLGEGLAFAFKQPLDPPRLETMPRCDHRY